MIVFYKLHKDYLVANAVAPDKRRYLIAEEPSRHYIDLDVYGDSAKFQMPLYWHQAVAKYSEDSLKKHGIVPWHVYLMKVRLTEAFKRKDMEAILKLSADIGHYIADAHVPLHTTKNYNGQFTGQLGIHGLWESRIPEVYGDSYEAWAGTAEYLDAPQKSIWQAVYASHNCLEKVFSYEKESSREVLEDRKFAFEERNGQNIRVYSKEFIKIYNDKLQGQIEDRFLASIKLLGAFWYTAWVDAGQPDLISLGVINQELAKDEKGKKDADNDHDCSQHFH